MSDKWSEWTDEPSADAPTPDYGPGHVGVWCDVDGRNVSTAAELDAWVKERLWTFMPYGGRGQVWLVGSRLKEGSPHSWALEVAVDPEVDRAAVTWLPTGQHGSEPSVSAPDEPLVVQQTDPDYHVVEIPAEQARVTVEVATRAMGEYVETGERPACLGWAT